MKKVEQIYQDLRQQIIQGHYDNGQRLSEEVLADSYRCSRTPIRQVLQRLEKEHLIEIVPKSGSYIRLPSAKDLRDFLHVRAYLEGLAYRLVIAEQPPELLESLVARLQDLYDTMHHHLVQFSDAGIAAYNEAHLLFHFEIISFTKNKLLIRFFCELNLPERPSFVKRMTYEDIQRTEAEHRQIISSIQARDPAGEAFVINHLFHKKSFGSDTLSHGGECF